MKYNCIQYCSFYFIKYWYVQDSTSFTLLRYANSDEGAELLNDINMCQEMCSLHTIMSTEYLEPKHGIDKILVL